MATITPANVSLATQLPPDSCRHSGLLAGEALTAGAPCYIKSDGKVWLSDGSAADAEAQVDGYPAINCPVGEAVTLYFDVEFNYASGLTPGAKLFLSATEGRFDDAATTGGTGWIAKAITATRIFVRKSTY